jgi:hypothetical protein
MIVPVGARSREPAVTVRANYYREPLLQFCGGRDADPKRGLATHGPYSLGQPRRHPRTAKIGFIGSNETIDAARQWLAECANGVPGDDDHPAFPGFTGDRGFFADVEFDSSWVHSLPQRARDDVLAINGQRERFEAVVELIEEGLRWFAGIDRPPDLIVLALPDDIVEKCAVADYVSGEGDFHRDLRRAIKAAAMRHRVTTQLLLSRTVRGGSDVDHRSVIAWNFFTTLYFKLGAMPWAPIGLSPDTCFVGVSFFRPLGRKNTVRASIAQAFDATGDALVLRGREFPWDPRSDDRQPHLTAAGAQELLELALKLYKAETQGKTPRRIVVHKSSRFTQAELEGFRGGLGDVREYDFAALAPTDRVRLLRAGQYPVLRGTHFGVGDLDFLYTTGFLPTLGGYPHGHVPSAIQVADRYGDAPLHQLLRELLVLTKLNWNSSGFSTSMPVTLMFAKDVGDIMREIRDVQNPLPNFKYYI